MQGTTVEKRKNYLLLF